jgi:hypothetical protein
MENSPAQNINSAEVGNPSCGKQPNDYRTKFMKKLLNFTIDLYCWEKCLCHNSEKLLDVLGDQMSKFISIVES